MIQKTDPKAIFSKYLPEPSVEYCFDLWKKHQFHLNIKQKRKSKRGDYFFDPFSNKHHISVNADLNPFAFLITYLHEVAHLLVRTKYKKQVLPHGIEWKNEFASVLKPVLVEKIFPDEVQIALLKYLKNPKASTCSDPALLMALNHFDEKPLEGTYLQNIKIGSNFNFSDRIFTLVEVRRTRMLCKEINTNKSYLISKMAMVKPS